MKHKQPHHQQRDAWLARLADNATPDMDECVAMLSTSLEWHAEGDVHTHTNWVLQELYRLFENEAKHLQSWQRQALILGVILHDIAKPVRTREMVINIK